MPGHAPRRNLASFAREADRYASSLSLAAFLASCARPDVKYSDLRPATTAAVSGNTVWIHLGSDRMNSACWTRPKAKVAAQIDSVTSYRTLRKQSREFAVRLPASVRPHTVSAVWIDPDGRKVPIPMTSRE
jgi:hypothetical protein